MDELTEADVGEIEKIHSIPHSPLGPGQAIYPKLLFFLKCFLVFVRNARHIAHTRLHRNRFPQRAFNEPLWRQLLKRIEKNAVLGPIGQLSIV